ncbi:MAG: class I adenylate-forming enzyme family protein [Proteobacteria bacterium]|nr:class I adenylate-forming enzyme family protein [Pseudomonadota bacterium]
MNQQSANPLIDKIASPPPLLSRIEDYLEHWAALTPDAEAIVDSHGRLSYAQLRVAVLGAARAMRAYGVKDGACVAVLAPPSIDAFVSFLAANTLGATWLGLNPKYTRAELEHVIQDAQPVLTLARSRIAERDYLGDLQAIRDSLALREGMLVLLDDRDDARGIEKFGGRGGTDLVQGALHNEVALFVYTSGTTGRPKAARLSHRALVRAAAIRAEVWKVTPFRSINNLPINHVGSVGDIACSTLVAGGCQVCLERFTPAATLECLQRERVSFWYQVPTMFQMCLDAASSMDIDWSHLQAAIWSGGRASHSLIERLANVSDFLAVDYSMTESVGAITLSPLTKDADTLDDNVGWPEPGRELRLVDVDTLLPAARGAAGEVQIRDPWMFDGYRATGQAVDAFTTDGWFRTGDLAIQGENGAWRIVGRSKEMFKSGGYNVYPREIELVLEAHPGVASVAVVETSDPLYGEIGIAFVVPNQPVPAPTMLDSHCRDHLANYKIPKRFIMVDELPMLPIGKVDKVALRRQVAGLRGPR